MLKCCFEALFKVFALTALGDCVLDAVNTGHCDVEIVLVLTFKGDTKVFVELIVVSLNSSSHFHDSFSFIFTSHQTYKQDHNLRLCSHAF